MQKIRERKIRLLCFGLLLLVEELENSTDIFLQERPFLTGGELEIVSLYQERKESKLAIKSMLYGLWSQLNTINQ